MAFTVVNEGYCCCIERLGKQNKIVKAGILIYIPIIDKFKKFNWFFFDFDKDNNKRVFDSLEGYLVPTNEMVYNPEPYQCLTKDEIPLEVDLYVTFKIIDVKESLYNTENLFGQIQSIINTTVYSIIKTYNYTELEVSDLVNFIEKNIKDSKIIDYGVNIENIRIEKLNVDENIEKARLVVVKSDIESKAFLKKIENEKKLKIAQHEINLSEQKLNLEIEKEKVNYKIEIKNSELNYKINESNKLLEFKLKSLEDEAKLMEKYPELIQLKRIELQAESFKFIAKSENAKLIVTPNETMDIFKQIPVVQSISSN